MADSNHLPPRTIVLLGAGASVDAGMPDARNLTSSVEEYLRDSNGSDYQVFKLVLSCLQYHKTVSNSKVASLVDIEEVISALDFLAERRAAWVNAFVGSWRSEIEALDTGIMDVRSAFRLEKLIYDKIMAIYDAMKETEKCIPSEILQDGALAQEFISSFTSMRPTVMQGQGFRLARSEVVNILKNVLFCYDRSAVSYLEPLITMCVRNSWPITTLNYDNTLELACNNLLIPYDYGINRWRPGREVNIVRGKLALLKIHGSLNWYVKYKENRKIGNNRVLLEWRPSETGPMWVRNPNIIFGRNKFQSSPHNFALYRYFHRKLFKSKRLIVIGYSFRDGHVNEFINEWFASGGKKMLVIDPAVNILRGESILSAIERSYPRDVYCLSKGAADGIQYLCSNNWPKRWFDK